MKRKLLFTIILLALFCNLSYAQGTISGTVKDSQNKPVIGATVLLADSLTKQTTATDVNGAFTFRIPKNGPYTVKASFVGFVPAVLPAILIDQDHANRLLPPLILQPSAGQSLKEVVITYKKPMVEQQIDRTVVNVDVMISAGGSNALDILAKSPGVVVDANDDINLNGKNNVLILIDDRPTYLSAQNLAAYLRSLPGGMLDKLELISNPPARYDANGNAVINIVLKKNQAKGFNGALNLGYNQGRYTRSNDALNVNYRTGRFNIFSNIGFARDANFSDQTSSRYFSDRTILQNSFYDQHSNNYSGRAGIDYFISPKTTMGMILTGGTRPKSDQLRYNSDQYDQAMQLDSIGKGNTSSNYLFQNYGINLNLQHKFDDKGQVLKVNADQLNYHSTSSQVAPLDIYLPNGNLASDQQRLFTQPSDVHIYAAKADYTRPLPGKAQFDAGVKSSYVRNDNQTGWFNQASNILVPDFTKTDHFKYDENINSAYVNVKKEWKCWALQGGLRLENTNAMGHQLSNPVTPDITFTKHFTSLFPSLFLLHKLDSLGDHTLVLSYSKRIRRPSYQQLNPFLFYQDQYSYNLGNPDLLPSFTQYLELKYSFKQYFGLTLSYGGGNNGISPVTQANGAVFTTSPLNFADNHLFGIIPYVSLTPTPWWTINLNAVILFQTIKGTTKGVDLDQHVNTHELQVTNQFKISKTWSAELDGFFPDKQTYAQSSNDAIYNISAGLQKSILCGQGTLRLNANDIFDQLTLHSQTLGINGVMAFNSRQTDNRCVGLSFTYRFGKAANARKRNDSGSAEDEKGRTN